MVAVLLPVVVQLLGVVLLRGVLPVVVSVVLLVPVVLLADRVPDRPEVWAPVALVRWVELRELAVKLKRRLSVVWKKNQKTV